MNQLFKIFYIDENEVQKIALSENKPHSHQFEELIIGVKGSMKHFIDFETHAVDAPFVSFVTKNKVHRVVPETKDGHCSMWVIRFKSDFLADTIFQLYAYYHHQANLMCFEHESFKRIVQLCEFINEEWQTENPSLSVIRHLLNAIFATIDSKRVQTNEVYSKTQNQTFKNFLVLLEQHFQKPVGVEFYAEKLFMSARTLNNICHAILQQSVSEIIETRKLIEAKNQLISTNKTIAEIGFELGYNEKSYFTNVFKKKTGQTPTEFREEMSKQIG